MKEEKRTKLAGQRIAIRHCTHVLFIHIKTYYTGLFTKHAPLPFFNLPNNKFIKIQIFEIFEIYYYGQYYQLFRFVIPSKEYPI